MANIKKFLEKQKEEKALLIDRTGNFVKKDKVEPKAKKVYVKALSKNEIDFSCQFGEFFDSYIKENYVGFKELTKRLENLFPEEIEQEEQKQEKSETVAK